MPDKLYNSHTLEKTSEETSGSLTIWRDTPTSPYKIGSKFSPVPGVSLNVKKVNISDNVIGELNGKPFRQWQVVIEGSSEEVSGSGSDTNVKYSFSVSDDETSGSMEVTNKGASPALKLSIGGSFNVPGLGSVKCTSIKASNSYNENGVQSWSVTYEGVSGSSSDDDDNNDDGEETSSDEESTSYEFNGLMVRTVNGELLALGRSGTPMQRNTYTITNNSSAATAPPGGTYRGGTVISESIVKEVTKKNGVVTKTQYKHTIETEQ